MVSFASSFGLHDQSRPSRIKQSAKLPRGPEDSTVQKSTWPLLLSAWKTYRRPGTSFPRHRCPCHGPSHSAVKTVRWPCGVMVSLTQNMNPIAATAATEISRVRDTVDLCASSACLRFSRFGGFGNIGGAPWKPNAQGHGKGIRLKKALRGTGLPLNTLQIAVLQSMVSVWARHIELKSLPGQHRVHDEDVGGGLVEGGVVCRSLAQRRRAECVHFQATGCRLGAAHLVDLAYFSRQAATDGAAIPRFGCSTASAIA